MAWYAPLLIANLCDCKVLGQSDLDSQRLPIIAAVYSLQLWLFCSSSVSWGCVRSSTAHGCGIFNPTPVESRLGVTVQSVQLITQTAMSSTLKVDSLHSSSYELVIIAAFTSP